MNYVREKYVLLYYFFDYVCVMEKSQITKL